MNIANLQATLRHFAAERDWQPFHTPKNLATALMVEAAELAEVFQWMTPEESREAHLDAVSKQRIGEEIADVLLYLLQVADHTQVDVEQALKDKLVRNAQKYPAKRVVAVVEPIESQLPDTHILLDYENVQPTEVELRAMVPEATRVWVFHGPHQKQVEQRFASFGTGMTTVPISKTGKNALDFHLSFYMGYIASRNQQAKLSLWRTTRATSRCWSTRRCWGLRSASMATRVRPSRCFRRSSRRLLHGQRRSSPRRPRRRRRRQRRSL